MKLHNGLVSVTVFQKSGDTEVQVVPGANNHLGKFKVGDRLRLRLEIDQNAADHVVPVYTDRPKTTATKLQEIAPGVYEHVVRVIEGKFKKVAVSNDNNLVRLLVMTNKGQIASHNVAVIVQKGEFYLAPAVTYRVQAYRNEHGRVAVPDLYDNNDGKGSFVGIRRFVEEHYVPQFALPPIASYEKPSVPDHKQIQGEDDIIVLSWSLANGTGVGVRKDGEYVKLYWANVLVADRTPVYLQEGEIVRAASFKAPDDPRASLKLEATGITRTEELAAEFVTA